MLQENTIQLQLTKGEAIAVFRKRRGLTVQDLAAIAQVSRHSVSAAEDDRAGRALTGYLLSLVKETPMVHGAAPAPVATGMAEAAGR